MIPWIKILFIAVWWTLTVSAVDTATGLIGSWSFESSGTDASGYGYAATAVNATNYISGKNGTALATSNNGANTAYVNLGRGSRFVALSNQWTLAGWVKWMGGTGSGYSVIFSRFSPTRVFLVDVMDGSGSLRIYLNTGAFNQTVAGVMTANQWVHLAITCDGSQVRLFTNGSPCGNWPWSTGLSADGAADILLGARADNPSLYAMNGAFDDVRIYERPLAAVDALALAVGAPTAAITNLTNQGEYAAPVLISGNQISPVGISNTWLSVVDSNHVEIFRQTVTSISGSAWSASPNLPVGVYQLTVTTTNSNGVGFTGTPMTIRVTVFSKMTIQCLDAMGNSLPGCRLMGPGSTAFDGFRVADANGRVTYSNLKVGSFIALTNYFTGRPSDSSLSITNFLMPGADMAFVWSRPESVSERNIGVPVGVPGFYLPSSKSPMAIRIPASGGEMKRIQILLRTLRGDRRWVLHEGFSGMDEQTIQVPWEQISPVLDIGLYLMETRVWGVSTDSGSASVTRSMMVVGK